MSRDPRKPTGAAALTEIVERLTGLGAEVQKALEKGGSREEAFDVETTLGRMTGRMGVRVGPASRPASGAPRKRPSRPATKQSEPLVDVYFDGVNLVVTTETDDPEATAVIEGENLTIRSFRVAERSVPLPCPVQPDTLRFATVNGVLEATMKAEAAT